MKPRDERILWIFGAAAAAIAGLALVLVPGPAQLQTLSTQLDDARGRLAVVQRSGTTFESLQRVQQELDDKRSDLDTLFATREGAVVLIDDIERLGAVHGVSAAPLFSGEPGSGVHTVPLDVTVTGPLDNALRFAEALVTRKPAVVISSIQLSGGTEVRLTLHAQVAWR